MTIDLGFGNDFAFGTPLDDTILGGPDNDVIVGGLGNDDLQGGGGDDTIFGRSQGAIVFNTSLNLTPVGVSEAFVYELAKPYNPFVPDRIGVSLGSGQPVQAFDSETFGIEGAVLDQIGDFREIGDFNADGRNDYLLQGADRSFVVFGPIELESLTSVAGAANIVIDHEAFGVPATGAGDINGDGVEDLAFLHVTTENNVLIVYGGEFADPLTASEWPRDWNQSFRNSLGAQIREYSIQETDLEIVDGQIETSLQLTHRDSDQYADLAVFNSNQQGPGDLRLGYIVSGRAIANDSFAQLDTSDSNVVLQTVSSTFGGSFTTQRFADLNGDGLDERVSFAEGGINLELDVYLEFGDIGANYRFLDVFPLGDLNADGYDDFGYQSVEYDPAFNPPVAIQTDFRIALGQPDLSTLSQVPSITVSGFNANAHLSASTADVDGDGERDLIIVDPADDVASIFYSIASLGSNLDRAVDGVAISGSPVDNVTTGFEGTVRNGQGSGPGAPISLTFEGAEDVANIADRRLTFDIRLRIFEAPATVTLYEEVIQIQTAPSETLSTLVTKLNDAFAGANLPSGLTLQSAANSNRLDISAATNFNVNSLSGSIASLVRRNFERVAYAPTLDLNEDGLTDLVLVSSSEGDSMSGPFSAAGRASIVYGQREDFPNNTIVLENFSVAGSGSFLVDKGTVRSEIFDDDGSPYNIRVGEEQYFQFTTLGDGKGGNSIRLEEGVKADLLDDSGSILQSAQRAFDLRTLEAGSYYLRVYADATPIFNFDAENALDANPEVWESGVVGGDATFAGFGTGVSLLTGLSNPQGINAAYSFDGSSGGFLTSLNALDSAMTMESAAWEVLFRPSDLIGDEVLFETGGDLTGMSLNIEEDPSGFRVLFVSRTMGGTRFELRSAPIAKLQSFTHAMATWDQESNELQLYIDGVAVGAPLDSTGLTDWSGGDNAGIAQVSGGSHGGGLTGFSNFSGDIATVRIYDSATPPASFQIEIAAPVRGQTHETATHPDRDTIDGGDGNDKIAGNDDLDTIFGGSGSDEITGEPTEVQDRDLADPILGPVPASELVAGNVPAPLNPVRIEAQYHSPVVFFDDFESGNFDRWSSVETATIDGVGINEPSGSLSARFNGNPDNSDLIESPVIDLEDVNSAELIYHYQQTGGGEIVDVGDDLFVEFSTDGTTWTQLAQHLGNGTSETVFTQQRVQLPPAALASNFQFRIRNTANGIFDDWFVDDVSVTVDRGIEPELRGAVAEALGIPVTIASFDGRPLIHEDIHATRLGALTDLAVNSPRVSDVSVLRNAVNLETLDLSEGTDVAVSRTPVADTYIRSDQVNSSFGSANNLLLVPAHTFIITPLVRFDLSDLAGYTVTDDATFELNVISIHPSINTSKAIELHESTAGWGEGTTFATIPGGGLYGSHDPTILDSITANSSTQSLVFTIPGSVIQGWIDNPISNKGLVIYFEGATENANDINLFSSESANPPTLDFSITRHGIDGADLDVLTPMRLTTGPQAGELVGTSHLQSLDLTGQGGIADVSALRNLTELRDLRLGDTGVNPTDQSTLIALAAMTELETLTLTTDSPIPNLVVDQGQTIDVYGTMVTGTTPGVQVVSTATQGNLPVVTRDVASAITQVPDLSLANGGSGVNEGQTVSVDSPTINTDYRLPVLVDGVQVDELVVVDPNIDDLHDVVVQISVTASDGTATDLVPRALNFQNDTLKLQHQVLDGQSNITTAFWFKTNHTNGQAIVSGANNTEDDAFQIWLADDTTLQLFDESQSVTWNIASIADDTFHHYAITRDQQNNQAELFIDGLSQGIQPFGSTLENIQIEPGGLIVGQEQDSVGGGFDSNQAVYGTIDELAIWSRVLNSTEIADVMGGEIDATSSSLRLWLPMNEGAGTTVSDRGPLGLDASLNASAYGRFIRVRNTGSGARQLHIGEIEAFSRGVVPSLGLDGINDLALGSKGTTFESSVGPPQHGANEAVFNGVLDVAGATWSTLNGVGNEYVLDLGASFDLETIRVWQRGDGCCQNRLSNFEVAILEDNAGSPGDVIFSEVVAGTTPTNSYSTVIAESASVAGWTDVSPLSGTVAAIDDGTYTMTVTVADETGIVDSTVSVYEVNNVSPTINSLNVTDTGPCLVDAPMFFDARDVVDPGAIDTFTYLWEVTSNNGQSIFTSSDIEFDFTPHYAGTYTVQLTVTDSDGDADVFSQDFDVVPMAMITTPSEIPVAGTVVSLTSEESSHLAPAGNLRGTDQSVVREYDWTVSFGGNTVAQATTENIEFVPVQSGTYSVTLKIDDLFLTSGVEQSRLVHSETTTFTVDPADAIAIVAPTDLSAEGDTLTFSISGLTPVNELGSRVTQWSVSPAGSVDVLPVDDDETFSIRANADDNYTVSLMVTDTILGTAFVRTASNVIVAVENSAPTMIVDSVEGIENSAITLSATVFDAANDTQTYIINWGDGSPIDAGSVSAGLISESHTYAQDGTFTAALTVTDSDGASRVQTIEAVIRNAAPIAFDDLGLATDEDSNLAIPTASLLANDTDPATDPFSLSGFDAISINGATITLDNGVLTYDPTTSGLFNTLPAGQSVVDTFKYKIQDNAGDEDTAEVSITVNGINDAPIALDDENSVNEDKHVDRRRRPAKQRYGC